MRKPLIRGLVGIAASSLPAVMCIVGMQLDRSRFRHDPRYVASIPGAMISGASGRGVPAALIMSSTLSMSRRIGLTAAIWCLLALKCGLAVYFVLMGSLRLSRFAETGFREYQNLLGNNWLVTDGWATVVST